MAKIPITRKDGIIQRYEVDLPKFEKKTLYAKPIKQWTKEQDIQILKQLYYGNHLEPNELERAHKLLYGMNAELKRRVR